MYLSKKFYNYDRVNDFVIILEMRDGTRNQKVLPRRKETQTKRFAYK